MCVRYLGVTEIRRLTTVTARTEILCIDNTPRLSGTERQYKHHPSRQDAGLVTVSLVSVAPAVVANAGGLKLHIKINS